MDLKFNSCNKYFVKIKLLTCFVCISESIQNDRLKYTVGVTISDGDPLISRKRILIHISGGLDYILIFITHFLSVLKYVKLMFSS